MKSKAGWSAVRIVAVAVMTVVAGARAQAPTAVRFSGFINDYTPASGVGGPWEMHGRWSLKINPETGLADFDAAMTMEHPDYWVVLNPTNLDNPGARNPHTHHITITGATVSSDTSTCPADSPTTTGRLMISAPVTVTGNGSAAPFESKGPSTLQVCITGGTLVPYSNVTLMFTSTSPATGHFGMQPIHGVVRKVKYAEQSDGDDSDR